MAQEITLTSDITVRLIQSMGGDHMVVAAAKVSTTGEDAIAWALQEFEGDNRGFINFLMKYRHGTPFEHAAATFFAHCPAMVWWQWVRHRIGFSYNLESGRYHELEPVFWIPKRERKLRKVDGFKAARPRFEALSEDEWVAAYDTYVATYQANWDGYQRLMEQGIANEAARSVLGFGIYYSGWVTCNPRSIMAFLSLRTHEPDATFVSYPEAEIEIPARIIEGIFAKGWPLTHEAFCKNGRVGP